MSKNSFPTPDMKRTGRNIKDLRKKNGYSVRDMQDYFGFTTPQAVYKWQQGRSLPSVDNLLALSILFDTPMDNIIVASEEEHCGYDRGAFSIFFIPQVDSVSVYNLL